MVATLVAFATIGCRTEDRRAPAQSNPPVIGSVTVDEVRPLLPSAGDFTAVRTVTEVMQGKGGRVGIELCFDSAAPEDVWNKLSARVTALGWMDVIKQNRAIHGKDTILLAGRKAPFTLTGEVLRAPATATPGVPECDGAKGQTLVILYVHRAVAAS